VSQLNPPLLAIVGPTAVGKSALALALARAFEGEIVNADSRQVYRHMDVGTAKPTPAQRDQVPHHLIDILDPDQEFSLALFLQLAQEAVRNIHGMGKLPMVVGGTGQYIWALLEDWKVPQVPPDPQLRRALESEELAGGQGTLHKRLQTLDPQGASSIDPRNIRRVVRALELHHVTGKLPSSLRMKGRPPYRHLVIGLTMPREALYQRIDQRVDRMLEQEFVSEVEGLLKLGYTPDLASMSSLGYREIASVLGREIDLVEATRRIKFATHGFTRRQYTWFRRGDSRIRWVDATGDPYPEAEGLVRDFLRGQGRCGRMGTTP